MEPLLRDDASTPSGGFISYITYPITFVLSMVSELAGFLAEYGWYLVGAGLGALYLFHKLRPSYLKWKQAREDAEYHKDPDKALARMEAIQRARERQQEMLLRASQQALEKQKEREERKRAETAERLKKYGAAAGGQRLGALVDEDYLPLSGGASASSYRPPKKSKCGGGGCGR